MEPDLKRLYARIIDTQSGRCFCLVGWGPDLDNGGFDVTLFHARSLCTYKGTGLQAPPRWIKPDLWIPLAKRALAAEAAPADVKFNFNPETGALSWTWPPDAVGMSAGVQQAVGLTRVGAKHIVPAEETLPFEQMASTVWESCYRLLVTCRQLDSQLTRQSDALVQTQRELQECTESHKARIEELHVKFAMVLDAKKDKLIEQRERIKELEAQLKAAQQELAEAEALETDVDDDLEEQQQQQQQEAEAGGPQRASELGGTAQGAAGPSAYTAAAGHIGGCGITRSDTPAVSVPPTFQTRNPPPPRRTLPMRLETVEAGPPEGGGSRRISALIPSHAVGGADIGRATATAVSRGRNTQAVADEVAAAPVSALGAATTGSLGIGGWEVGVPDSFAGGAGGTWPPALGTYRSLGATQLDEELMAASTQPVEFVVDLSNADMAPVLAPGIARWGAALQQQPPPLRPQQSQHQELWPVQATALGNAGGGALTGQMLEVLQHGGARAGVGVAEMEVDVGRDGEQEEGDDDEDEEDDAALGLVFRRG